MRGGEKLVGDRYELGELLGRGGMGAVYRAQDRSTHREVALKRLSHDDESSPSAHDELRFRREFHTLASLHHPRIVEAYDYGMDDGGCFYTMELLEGMDLKALTPMLPAKVCSVLRDIAAALAFLHARGLVHRDLKPQNVRLRGDGAVKLIDFGVLATVGSTPELAGTPNYTAPETVYGRMVDGRTDLYALGAVAYVLLTRRPPYPARSFDELRDVWRDELPPPSTYAPKVSEALDDLILEMLCLNPLGRPASAAVVMDRLTAIGGLARDPDIELRHGYLASAAMVGRRREMARLRGGIDEAAHGGRATAFVRAPSGTGKSRLLRELALEGKLAGAAVASISCETSPRGPYGVVAELLRLLRVVQPRIVADIADEDASTLVRVISWLTPLLQVQPAAPVADPAEERMRVQRALCRWLSSIAARQMVVLLIDDVQRADEASAAVLAALSRDPEVRGLYLAVAQRSQEPVRAEAAVSMLAHTTRHVTLGGLDQKEVEELVRSFFGDVVHAERLAHWMHRFAEGSPLLCSELARHFVDTDVIRWSDGEWILPSEIGGSDLPTGLGAAMDRRVERLSDTTRTFAEILAVHGGRIPLSSCVALSEGGRPESDGDDKSTFIAIDELAREGVLLEEAGNFAFRHDGLREALLRGLDEERRAALHLRVGQHLQGAGASEGRAAEIGWHLLEGGEQLAGAMLLERAGQQLYDTQALRDCLAPLAAAHEVYEQEGWPMGRRMGLLFQLLAAGWVSDRQVGARYAHQAVRAYWRHSGIAYAERLRFLGRHLALLIGVCAALLRWLATFGPGRGPNPANAVMSFAVALGYACGLTYSANRRDEVLELCGMASPLAVFRKRLPYAAYLGVQTFPAIIDGRLGVAEQYLSRALDIIASDRLTPASDWDRRFAEAGLRGLRVILDVNQFNPRMHADLEAIEALEFRYYDVVVMTARVVRHRYRGEEAEAREIERKMESATLQLGSWSTDLQILLFAHPAYALCQDVLGLKRCLEELERFVDEGFLFQDRVTMTRAEIHRLRGELDESRALLERFRDELGEHNYLMRQYLISGLAETELSARRFDRAAELARETIALGASDDHGVVLPRLRCARILGLALHGLGESEQAISCIEDAVAEAEALDCPVMAGALHDARARIAIASGDRLAYEVHCAKAGEWLLPTENPYLVAMHERLVRVGRSDSSMPSSPGSELTLSDEEKTYELPSAARRRLDDTATRRH